jgi:site-specific recombinase XerD
MTKENTRPSAISPHLLASFHAELERRQYADATIKLYLRITTELSQMIQERQIDLDALTPKLAAELVQAAGWPTRRRKRAAFVARRFVEHLVTIGLLKPTLTERERSRLKLRQEYEAYLRQHRGVSERTVGHCWRFADRFLEFRFGQSEVDYAAITAADTVAFLQKLTTSKAPFRDKTPPTHLRNFFQYLFKCGLTKTNLALGVPSIAQRYDARLPRHLSPDQVEAVLRAVRADARFGRRNYAMVLLMARLGLRSPEVVAIRLEDLDWRAGELLVRGKGQNHDRVPLPPEVGESLTTYIRQDRISNSRFLFVTGRAPHGPFKSGAVLNEILRTAFARTGVTPPGPYVGSHVLRHSLATNLVRQGASLDEVSDMLRHRSRSSTLIYAKLDIEGLRSIAQPWPVAGGAQ